MMMRTTLSALVLAAALPVTAMAATCGDLLKELQSTYAADPADDILAALSAVRRSDACNADAKDQAAAQVSGVLAARAGRFMAQGNLEAAEALLMKAPRLHWAVQAVRGEIAAKRGQREEAARLFNAALDTITDPELTKSNPALIPHAERIAKLAQENMMLAGTIDSTVTRGGGTRGVMRSAVRGIAIEAVGGDADPDYHEAEYVGGDTYDEPPKQDHAEGKDDYVAPPAYEEPEDYAEEKGYGQEKEYEEPPKEIYEDPYGGRAKEEYEVADKAAEVNQTIFLPIRFDFDSDHLNAKGKYEAETLGAFLIANKIKYITLVGHTDDKGSAEYNLDLSFRRAKTVRDFLIYYGVKTYIRIDGKGEYQPPEVYDPYAYDQEELRAIARRVELVLEG